MYSFMQHTVQAHYNENQMAFKTSELKDSAQIQAINIDLDKTVANVLGEKCTKTKLLK